MKKMHRLNISMEIKERGVRSMGPMEKRNENIMFYCALSTVCCGVLCVFIQNRLFLFCLCTCIAFQSFYISLIMSECECVCLRVQVHAQ